MNSFGLDNFFLKNAPETKSAGGAAEAAIGGEPAGLHVLPVGPPPPGRGWGQDEGEEAGVDGKGGGEDEGGEGDDLGGQDEGEEPAPAWEDPHTPLNQGGCPPS